MGAALGARAGSRSSRRRTRTAERSSRRPKGPIEVVDLVVDRLADLRDVSESRHSRPRTFTKAAERAVRVDVATFHHSYRMTRIESGRSTIPALVLRLSWLRDYDRASLPVDALAGLTPAQRCWFTARATVASGRTRCLAQRLASTLRCSVLVCLRCDASHAETLPRGRAIDA